MNTIQLNFEGYWREKNKNGIPQYIGIYVVYRCIYKEVSDSVTLKEIIYIGQSNNIRERITNHDKIELFNEKFSIENIERPPRTTNKIRFQFFDDTFTVTIAKERKKK